MGLLVALALLVSGSKPYRVWREIRSREPLGWIDSERRTPPEFMRPPLPDPNGWDVYREAADLWAERRDRAEEAGEDPSRVVREYIQAYGVAGPSGAEPWRAEAEAVVLANNDVLAKLDEASRMECVDASEVLWTRPIGVGAHLHQTARLTTAKGLLCHSRGDDASAVHWLSVAAELGIDSARGGAVIALLTGDAALQTVAEAEARAIPGAEWDRSALLAHAQTLREVLEGQTLPSDALTREAMMVSQFYDWLEGTGIGHSALVRFRSLSASAASLSPEELLPAPEPEGTLDVILARVQIRASRAWAADRMARLIEQADLPPTQSSYAELADRMEADIRDRGDPIAGQVLHAYRGLPRKHWQVRAAVDAASLVACLEAHRIDHGAYPARLEGLVPDYIGTLLEDPWSAEPLRYRLEGDGYTLYSVGPNGVDDGGIRGGKGETFWQADLVFVPPQPRETPEPPG